MRPPVRYLTELVAGSTGRNSIRDKLAVAADCTNTDCVYTFMPLEISRDTLGKSDGLPVARGEERLAPRG